jgi:hypothetical protein
MPCLGLKMCKKKATGLCWVGDWHILKGMIAVDAGSLDCSKFCHFIQMSKCTHPRTPISATPKHRGNLTSPACAPRSASNAGTA